LPIRVSISVLQRDVYDGYLFIGDGYRTTFMPYGNIAEYLFGFMCSESNL
jgi:hypothetical protein